MGAGRGGRDLEGRRVSGLSITINTEARWSTPT
jgi:hypothetical protein